MVQDVAYVTYGILEDGPNGLAGTGGLAVINLVPSILVFDPADGPAPDRDGDGIADSADNCLEVANPDQADANGEGYGDACDADYNDDGVVSGSDIAVLAAAFGTRPGQPGWTAEMDRNGNGVIDGSDVSYGSSRFGTAPGPSGLSCAGFVPCTSQ